MAISALIWPVYLLDYKYFVLDLKPVQYTFTLTLTNIFLERTTKQSFHNSWYYPRIDFHGEAVWGHFYSVIQLSQKINCSRVRWKPLPYPFYQTLPSKIPNPLLLVGHPYLEKSQLQKFLKKCIVRLFLKTSLVEFCYCPLSYNDKVVHSECHTLSRGDILYLL